jgi:hypothetical protein
MKSQRRQQTWWRSALVLVFLGVAWCATAAEPTPTPTPSPTPQPGSLADAVRQAQSKSAGAQASETPIVISNANLSEYAAKGSLTEVTGSGGDKGKRRPAHSSAAGTAEPEAPRTAAESSAEESKKSYWRSRYQEQQALVAAMKSEIEQLDKDIPGLWFDFYRWDDPVHRDGVIKPKLDQSLARRDDLAARLPAEEAKLPQILDEARRDGAQPGWFRGLD